jgi:hypothetical protein
LSISTGGERWLAEKSMGKLSTPYQKVRWKEMILVKKGTVMLVVKYIRAVERSIL